MFTIKIVYWKTNPYGESDGVFYAGEYYSENAAKEDIKVIQYRLMVNTGYKRFTLEVVDKKEKDKKYDS